MFMCFSWELKVAVGKIPQDFGNRFMMYIYMREFKKHFHDLYICDKGLKGLTGSDMVKPEKFVHLHLVYHFTGTLMDRE